MGVLEPILLIAIYITFFNITNIDRYNNTRIIVVGAGAAGIAAATRLYQNGFRNVIILEAGNRIGGRIHSVQVGEDYIDLGAQWCHGQINNVVYEMVHGRNLLTDDEQSEAVYHSRIKRMDPYFTDLLDSIMYFGFNDDADRSMGDVYTERYNAISRTLWTGTDQLTLAEDYLDLVQRFTEVVFSLFSWRNASARYDSQICAGNQYLGWNGRGYKTILEILMENAPIDHSIVFNTVVHNISVPSDGEIKITCSNGTEYLANHVIWTPSLGVLKHTHKTVFQPSLPEKKVRAIETLGFDACLKVYVNFSKPWWDDNFQGVKFVWASQDLHNYSQMLTDEPNKDGRPWYTYIADILPVQKYTNLVSVWFSGELVPEMENLSDGTIIDGIMRTLEDFFPDKYPNISRPDFIIRKSWYADPFFRGTYSYETVTSRKLGVSQAAELSKPIITNTGKPALLFAGEATHPIYYATVHGAIETGFREADRLINFYQ